MPSRMSFQVDAAAVDNDYIDVNKCGSSCSTASACFVSEISWVKIPSGAGFLFFSIRPVERL